MSLVNLAHVCSHLQNASLARLGLTSIPYSRLHLSLSLLLHKQGFLSQVKLAGPSPPPSCFPPGVRESTSHITGDTIFSPQGALQRAVSGVTVEGLRREGFGDEAIRFAMQEKFKSKAQLEKEGFNQEAARCILKYGERTREQMESMGVDEGTIAIVQNFQPQLADAKAYVEKWHGDLAEFEQRPEIQSAKDNMSENDYGMYVRRGFAAYQRPKIQEQLVQRGFDLKTLRHFAGEENSLRSERDLARDGVTVQTMGLDVDNQPYDPPPEPRAEDPFQHETEGIVTQANRASRRLWLGLKYWDGLPVLRNAKMLSKPTKRIVLNSQELSGLTRGRAAARGQIRPLTQIGEIMAVSTDLGLLEARECAERKVGGMVLCRIS